MLSSAGSAYSGSSGGTSLEEVTGKAKQAALGAVIGLLALPSGKAALFKFIKEPLSPAMKDYINENPLVAPHLALHSNLHTGWSEYTSAQPPKDDAAIIKLYSEPGIMNHLQGEMASLNYGVITGAFKMPPADYPMKKSEIDDAIVAYNTGRALKQASVEGRIPAHAASACQAGQSRETAFRQVWADLPPTEKRNRLCAKGVTPSKEVMQFYTEYHQLMEFLAELQDLAESVASLPLARDKECKALLSAIEQMLVDFTSAAHCQIMPAPWCDRADPKTLFTSLRSYRVVMAVPDLQMGIPDKGTATETLLKLRVASPKLNSQVLQSRAKTPARETAPPPATSRPLSAPKKRSPSNEAKAGRERGEKT